VKKKEAGAMKNKSSRYEATFMKIKSSGARAMFIKQKQRAMEQELCPFLQWLCSPG